MHIGVFIFATDYAIEIQELARALEERGFESLFLPEHTHIPTSRKTPFRGGAPLPKEYRHTYPDSSMTTAFPASWALRNLFDASGASTSIQKLLPNHQLDPLTSRLVGCAQ
jgi:alkanesulfonate monooxygenase SsuD/methylene tetrahydromethanopterin reductase-like flavin-dependent oxidoreductase (luciferase family)